MADVKKLVIERDRWLRGEKENVRLLRKGDGKMCCLGFFGLACGLTQDDILDQGEPQEVHNDRVAYGEQPVRPWPAWLVEFREADEDGKDRWLDTDDCGALIATNDDEALTEDEREFRIAGLFAKHGIEVEFK